MKHWIRRNRWAFAVIAVAVAVVGVTVIRPTWWESRGYRQPHSTVAFGQAADIGGVDWQLVPVTLPPEAGSDGEAAPNTRLVTYVLTRQKDGRPAALGEEYGACLPFVADDTGRRWASHPPMSLFSWALANNLGFACLPGNTKPLLIAARVPADADITSVEVNLAKKVDEDAKYRPDPAESESTIRFATG